MNIPKTSNRPPKKTNVRRVWIKGQLELRGESFATIARELGVSRQAVRHAVIRSAPRMERAIAAKLDMQPEEIWPERYQVGSQCKPTGMSAQ